MSEATLEHFKPSSVMVLERSIDDLEASAVRAFPDSSKRHNRTTAVRVRRKKYTKYDSDKLLVSATIAGETDNYESSVLFTGVTFTQPTDQASIAVTPSTHIHPIDVGVDVQVRCSCMDFHWTYAWYNSGEGSLLGDPPPPYQRVPGSTRPPRNPTNAPGLCKHLMRLSQELKRDGVFG